MLGLLFYVKLDKDCNKMQSDNVLPLLHAILVYHLHPPIECILRIAQVVARKWHCFFMSSVNKVFQLFHSQTYDTYGNIWIFVIKVTAHC